MEPGLVSDPEQAVRNKCLSPNLPFPLCAFGFTRLIGNLSHEGNLLTPRATHPDPKFAAKVMHHLVLPQSDLQNLALTLKLEHSEGRICVSVILLA